MLNFFIIVTIFYYINKNKNKINKNNKNKISFCFSTKQKEILQGWKNERSFSKRILLDKIYSKRVGAF